MPGWSVFAIASLCYLLLSGCAPTGGNLKTNEQSSATEGPPAAEAPRPAAPGDGTDDEDTDTTPPELAPNPAPVLPAAPPAHSPSQPAPPITHPIATGMCEGRDGFALTRDDSWGSVGQQRAAAAIQCDAYEIAMRAYAAGSENMDAKALYDRVRNLAALALDDVRARPVESSRLPLSLPHQQMYELAAKSERASGSSAIYAWTSSPWKHLHPLERAADNTIGALSTALMRGERRSLAFNVRNSSGSPRSLRIEIVVPGLPPGASDVYRVNWTGNDLSNWAAAELQRLGDASSARETTLLPGITQQIWIQIHPDFSAAAGRFVGSILLNFNEGPTTRIPLSITVFKNQLPQRPSLHFGGWDYADGRIDRHYTGIDVNQSELVKHLQERLVDTPWARRHVMHWEHLDVEGNLDAPPDPSRMEQWLSPWTDARRFRVFLNVGKDIAGIPVTDERFPHAVATWAQSWADEIRRLDKSPEQFDLLLVDEPATAEQAHVTELWAQAIRRSGAGFGIWSDPLWLDPFATPRSLIDAVDTLSINLGFADRAGTAYWDWARKLSREGKRIEIYGTEGPARRLDPYAYYRLTMWKAFFIGAAAVSFWGFSDTGGSTSDNEFSAERSNYSPFSISPEIQPGKHMEAAMEGIQDTQYLEMLQQIARTHPSHAVRQHANELLNDAATFVSRAPRSSEVQWIRQIESSEADRQRMAIGEFLDSWVPVVGSLNSPSALVNVSDMQNGTSRGPDNWPLTLPRG